MKMNPSSEPMRSFACEIKISNSRVMVVDDDRDIRELLQTIVTKAGHTCTVAADGQMAVEKLATEDPDVVITDLDMPKMGGIDLVKYIKAHCASDVIVMTGFSPKLSYSEFIQMGASDFVQKPVTPSEMVTRLERVLKERCYRFENKAAHERLLAAHEELQISYLDTIHRLVLAAEYKDEDTGDHIVRIGRFCTLMAREMGLPEKEVEEIGYAAPMHDIGKIGIPDHILLKPGKLTDEEFDIIKTHTTIGAKILAKSRSNIIRCAQQIAVSHHERWDGKGYPQGLTGERIPVSGRIVALADTFDALSSQRPYKQPYPLELCLEIMQKARGSQFDPDLLDLFMANIDAVVAIKKDVQRLEHGQLANFILSERDQAV